MIMLSAPPIRIAKELIDSEPVEKVIYEKNAPEG